jgi:Uma2 family endonuclease
LFGNFKEKTMAQPKLQETGYSYADYLGWDSGERYELIDGYAYAMAPAPTISHQKIVGEIFRQISNALIGKPCQPFIAPVDVLLPAKGEADDAVRTVVQPDFFVVCDPNKITERAIRGAPDWVVEVLSPATASRDHLGKRLAYEQAGVLEYWLVHPIDKVLLIYTLEAGSYGKPKVQALEGETIVGALPDLLIKWPESESLANADLLGD